MDSFVSSLAFVYQSCNANVGVMPYGYNDDGTCQIDIRIGHATVTLCKASAAKLEEIACALQQAAQDLRVRALDNAPEKLLPIEG